MGHALDEITTARDVASLLASTLGWEKSMQLVVDAVRALGFREEALRPDQRLAVLEQLGREGGLVGVAARFARTRTVGPAPRAVAAADTSDNGAPSVRTPSSNAGAQPAPRSGPLLSLRALAELLAQTVGKEKGEEALVASARRLSLPTDQLDREQAAALFEDLSQSEGIVGISARFAKARLLLKFSAAR